MKNNYPDPQAITAQQKAAAPDSSAATQPSSGAQPAPETQPLTRPRPSSTQPSSTRQKIAPRIATIPSLPSPKAAAGTRDYTSAAVTLVASGGLLLVATAYISSRSGLPWSDAIYWFGLLWLVVPIAARLASIEATRQERIGLVAMLGLGLYLVKVMHSPVAFTFSDELIHLRTLDDIVRSGQLFPPNPLLPVVAYYPGLETVAAALAQTAGLSLHNAGLVVIGVARLVLVLALYLLYEWTSGSPRAAGMGVLLYTANANFVYWSAQFAYESLALPLAVAAIFVITKREGWTDRVRQTGLTVIAVLLILAVVVTHHVSSFALAAFLLSLAGIYTALRLISGQRAQNVWGLAWFALLAAAVWLLLVATPAQRYLAEIFGPALDSAAQAITGQGETRDLFRSNAGEIAPLYERLIGIGSVLLMALVLPFGLWQVWQRYWHRGIVILFSVASLAYFGLLLLRFVPGSWELANRGTEFLFVGLALILALGLASLPVVRGTGTLATAVLTLIFLGGLIAGWSRDLRLARPYQVWTGEALVEPYGVTAARWAREYLGPDQIVIGSESNALAMLAYGGQKTPTSRNRGIQHLVFSPVVGSGELEILEVAGANYVVIDRRKISQDNMRGLYFVPTSQMATTLVDPSVFTRFDGLQGVSRVLDAGGLAIYDVGVLNGLTEQP